MNRISIKPGLAALIVVASMFAGWQTLLIVCALMLLFCELDEKVKNIMVSVIAFTAGLALFSLVWGLIVDGAGLVTKTLNDLVSVVNSYLSVDSKIDITKLQSYLLNPINTLVSIANNIVTYLITFVKFGFIISILTGKKQNDNFFVIKVNEFVNKFTNYVNVNNNENTNNQAM